MAYYKAKKNTRTYFKPIEKITYKAEDGVFKIYNMETKETSEVKSVTFYSVINLSKFIVQEEYYESQPIENIFTDKIALRDTVNEFKLVGNFKAKLFTVDGKKRMKLVDTETNQPSNLNATTALFVVGVNENGEPITIDLKGSIKMDLTTKNSTGSNAQKIKDFEDGLKITLTAQEDTISVGVKPRQKKIHLIDVVSSQDPIEDSVLMGVVESTYKLIQDDLAYYQRDRSSSSDEQSESDGERSSTEFSSDLEEIDINDLPF